ncbi:hypothetical protein F511_37188 [Dorcoceras hygrometricum]|uniref:Uncharacterized protein n=1 Tax=Dorcoceras hygrometricum TaxID=472368 RepID=A0A2Z7BHQ7_9LAMI|nr:hypothetical protein F511_37188 [Dorcoceras hygrometricum]
MNKQSEDMRSKPTEVSYPESKRRRTTFERGTVNQCMDLIVHPSVQISVDISDIFFKAFQHGQRVDRKDYTYVSDMVLLGVIAACGISDRVAAGAVVNKSSSGILSVQGRRGDVGA